MDGVLCSVRGSDWADSRLRSASESSLISSTAKLSVASAKALMIVEC